MDLKEMVLKIYEELRSENENSLMKELWWENENSLKELQWENKNSLKELRTSEKENSLKELIRKNEPIFDRFLTEFVSQTPLHIAIQHGSVYFAREILGRRPQLAHVLSSQGFSPLHMASAKGYAEIVKELLPLIADVSYDRDSKGWTPVHAAARKGHINVLKEFKRIKAEWFRDMTDRDETVLHLYVKYNNKVDELKDLLALDDDKEFVNQQDANGNSILHLAAMKKDKPMIRYLISAESTVVEINAANMNGFTALDVFTVYPGDSEGNKMVNELQLMGAVRSGEMFTEKAENKFKNISMVVGTLTATLCFQAALVPPGGLWQDDSNMGNNTLDQKNHTAGTSILADKDSQTFLLFQTSNYSVFFLSSVLILAGGMVGRISDVVDRPSLLSRRISDVVNIPSFLRRIKSDVVNMPSFLPIQLYLPVVLCFVSVMIYRCNEVHTPKGLPHDIRSNLKAWNITFLVLSLIICFGFCLLYVVPFRSLKKRLEVAKNRGSNVDTGNQQLLESCHVHRSYSCPNVCY